MKFGRSTWCVGVTACALAWSPAAWSATQAPVVSLDVAGECAGPRGASALREEVALRLPPGSTLSRGAQGANWSLAWSPDEAGACGLRLEGNGELVVVPLEAMAGAVAVREAAVRVAWWITTVEPEAPVAPEPGPEPGPEPALEGVDVPSEAPDTAPEVAPEAGVTPRDAEVDRGARGAGGATRGAKPDAMDVLMSGLDEPEAAEEPAPRIKDSVLQITESLNGWRSDSPGLFAELDESTTDAWVVDVFGEEVPATLYIEGAPRWTSVEEQPASGLGLNVGATLAERFSLGLAYMNLETKVLGEGLARNLDTHELSAVFAYSPWMNPSWTLGVQGEAGLALALYEDVGVELMPVIGARTHMLYKVASWIELGGAVGFQYYASSGRMRGLGAGGLSRPYVQALVRVSLF